MNMTLDFRGRTLVLTGANGGIGREVAKLFGRAGANLVLADVDVNHLETFVSEYLGLASQRVVMLGVDSTRVEDVDALIALAVSHFGEIDFLVPSAGIYLAQPFAQMTDEQWHRTISVNLDGVFYVTRRAANHLSQSSSIVNLSSMAAHRGAFYNAHYSASKGALISLTRSLARELGPKTRVNAVSPGIIDTPMASDLIKTRGADSIAQTPLKRLGTPAEIASVIGFLCSDAAAFITGEVIHVNGGLHIAG
jgi:3-oxoacyl-[acyl-carrier protein] reductase